LTKDSMQSGVKVCDDVTKLDSVNSHTITQII